MQKAARVISTIFIPPTLTLASFIFLAFTFENDFKLRIVTVAVALLFGAILQIASFVFFYKSKMINDIDVKQKFERTIPFYVSLIIFIIGFIVLLTFKVNVISIAFWFCYISNTILVVLINKYIKLSIHAMGVSGPLALLVLLKSIFGFYLVLILILVGWSRIKLKVHTFAEVLTGTILGFVSVYLQLLIFLKEYI
ncbi:MAG: hypothetical protein HXY50_16065 [Ignavibacteriaceae bacterium]|nr:hypothetical protein [Ignavibacteriaceae bacterium]